MFHGASLAVLMAIHFLLKKVHDVTAPIEGPRLQKAYSHGRGGGERAPGFVGRVIVVGSFMN